jgi:hypothetical protein
MLRVSSNPFASGSTPSASFSTGLYSRGEGRLTHIEVSFVYEAGISGRNVSCRQSHYVERHQLAPGYLQPTPWFSPGTLAHRAGRWPLDYLRL